MVHKRRPCAKRQQVHTILVVIGLTFALCVLLSKRRFISSAHREANGDGLDTAHFDDPTMQSTHQSPIKESKDLVNAATDHNSLPECDSSITFTFHSCCGFASEIIGLLNVMIYAKDTGRALFLRQRDWNYGSWSDFFVDFPQPSCRIPADTRKIGFAHAFLPKELDKQERKFKRAKHLFVNRLAWHIMDEHLMNHYTDPREKDTPAYWERAFKAQARALAQIWKPNATIKDLVVAQEAELQLRGSQESDFAGDRLPVIGVHVRRGDKAREVIAFGQQHIHLEDFIYSMTEFLEKNAINEPRIVMVMSDDGTVVDDLSELQPAWKFKQVLQDDKFKTETARQPHDQTTFDHMSRRQRIRQGQALIAELTLLSQADEVVVTLSSNVGRLLAVLRGWDQLHTLKSLDSPFFPTVFPPGLYRDQNPHALWAKQRASMEAKSAGGP